MKSCTCTNRRPRERHLDTCPATRRGQPQPSYEERKARGWSKSGNTSIRRIPDARLRAAVDRIIKERREAEGATALEALFMRDGAGPDVY